VQDTSAAIYEFLKGCFITLADDQEAPFENQLNSFQNNGEVILISVQAMCNEARFANKKQQGYFELGCLDLQNCDKRVLVAKSDNSVTAR